MVHSVVLDRLLRATTKKSRQLFFEKKVHRRQNPGYAYDRCILLLSKLIDISTLI